MKKSERKLVYYSANARAARQNYRKFLHLFEQIIQEPCDVTFTSPDIEELKKGKLALERKLEDYAKKTSELTDTCFVLNRKLEIARAALEEAAEFKNVDDVNGLAGEIAANALKEIKE